MCHQHGAFILYLAVAFLQGGQAVQGTMLLQNKALVCQPGRLCLHTCRHQLQLQFGWAGL